MMRLFHAFLEREPDNDPPARNSRRVRLVIYLAMAVTMAVTAVVSMILWLHSESVFDQHYPLNKAIATKEVDGLLLALHDIRSVEQGGYYVITSVRGTPEFLAAHPPPRRRLNPLTTTIDVAYHETRLGMGDVDSLLLARADSGGVQYVWSLLLPKRYHSIVAGKRVPADVLIPPDQRMFGTGKETVEIPINGFFFGDEWREATGAQKQFITRLEVAAPRGLVPATIAEIAAQTRSDLSALRRGSYATLYGGGPGMAQGALDQFDPDRITDAEYEPRVRIEMDWYDQMNRVWDMPDDAIISDLPRQAPKKK